MASAGLVTQSAEQMGFVFAPAPAPPRFWRLVRETSRAAWYRAGKSLPLYERVIFVGIAAFYNRHQCWPTSMELFEFLLELKARRPLHERYRLVKDINNVRPRLTDMNQMTPALVVTGARRRCTSQRSAGHVMYEWRIPQLGEAGR